MSTIADRATGTDDRTAVAVVRSSAAFSLIEKAMALIVRAYESSSFVRTAKQMAERWTQLPVHSRRFTGGVVLVVAVGVHLALTVWHQTPPGWIWLILPGMAAAIGGLLITASGGIGGDGAPR